MPRPKKNGAHINFIIDQDLRDRLEECADAEKRTMTATIELALTEFLDKYDKEKSENRS